MPGKSPAVGVVALVIAFLACWSVAAVGKADEQPAAGDTPPSPRIVKNWRVDDLAGDLERVQHGRSFESGKKAYEAALCGTCHRLNDKGGDLGPDLEKPVGKEPDQRKGIALLRAILEPSRDIDEKYQTHVIVTDEGMIVAGIISERSAEAVTIRTRPVGSVTQRTIPVGQISSIDKLDISMMPEGLVDTLTKEQILDLLAYVESRGNPRSPHFQ